MADEVLRERKGHVEILTINRPEARNAINRATAIALVILVLSFTILFSINLLQRWSAGRAVV